MKSHASRARAWLRTYELRVCESLSKPGFPAGQYALSVRREIWMPSFSQSSSAICSSRHLGLSRTICTLSCRKPPGIQRLPGRGLRFQINRKALLCQPIGVAGLTITTGGSPSEKARLQLQPMPGCIRNRCSHLVLALSRSSIITSSTSILDALSSIISRSGGA